MRLRYSFRFQQVGNTYLGAAVGQNAHLFNGVLQLNEVGHFIVSRFDELSHSDYDEQQTIALLTEALTREYEVDTPTARQSVQQVLAYLQQEGVLS